MDIQHLVDRLEDLIDEGFHWPFTRFSYARGQPGP
jgi:hypothetical protein